MVGKAALGVSLALCVIACGGTTRDGGPTLAQAGEGGAAPTMAGGTAGSAGMAGSAGTVDMSGAGGLAEPGPTPIAEIEACGFEERCPAGSAELIGESKRSFDDRVRCLLTGLYHRSPGVYRHLTKETSSSVFRSMDHVIAIHESPVVMYGVRTQSSSSDGTNSRSESGSTCRLAAPSYFKACLESLNAGDADGAWACLYGDDGRPAWFATCSSAERLSCEPPSCGTGHTECCAADPEPCAGLSEGQCELRDECDAIRGIPFAGDTSEWDYASATFIGCRSACRGGGGDAISCTVDPARPEQCYLIGTTAGPDGWAEDFECAEHCSRR